MNNGFIVLHRKLLDWYGYSSPNRLSLWISLLMLASHEDKRFVFNGLPIELKRGEFVTGRKKLSLLTGISESYVERLMSEFEKEGMLRQQKGNRNRIVSITSYNQYQDKRQQKDNGETTERQQKDTINNITIKQLNNKECVRFAPPLLADVVLYIKTEKYSVDAARFIDFYESKGWMIGKNKMKDWKAAVRTWERKNKPEVAVNPYAYLKKSDML